MSLTLLMVRKISSMTILLSIERPGFSAPTHRVFVIFDRFLTTSGESFYSVDSYSTDDYKIIPEYDNEI